MNVAGDHRPENHPVTGADVGIAGQWTVATRTADEFVIGKAEDSADQDSDDDSQGHKVFRVDFIAISLNQYRSRSFWRVPKTPY